MRPRLAAVAVLLSAVMAAPALADCSTEVALGVQAMGKQKFLRKETSAVGESGPFKMIVEYALPDRMRQVLTPLTENKPVEAIVVGDKAWTSNGDGWVESAEAETSQLVTYMIKSSSQIYQEVGKFECIGTESVDGRQLRGYRGLDPDPDPKAKGNETKTKNEAVRIMYLDPETGLPALSIFARADMLDKPIFKEVYSYPADIKIEAPANAKKAPAPANK
jgi:hypothetical protein